MDKQALAALLERVEKAEEPDRQLDAEITCALRPYHSSERGSTPHTKGGRTGFVKTIYKSGRAGVWSSSEYTSSIDAAVSLAERVLPGWYWMARKGMSPKQFGVAYVSQEDGPSFSVVAATPALALIAAIIKAKLETE